MADLALAKTGLDIIENRIANIVALRFKISPELNIILYIGDGYASPSDFFALEEAAFRDHPRQHGMITLVDASDLNTYFEVQDVRRFIGNIDRLTRNGLEPGPYIMVTRDWGLHLLADAAQLLAGNLDLRARMYFSLEESILQLGLSDHKKEIFQLWEACKLESSGLAAQQASNP